MNIYFISLVLFLGTYLLNILYITVFYHRGITHGAIKLKPRTLDFVVKSGSWITGIDPKAWACMHRMHHQHSDQAEDPHSPWNSNIFKVATAQLQSYKRILVGLHKKEEPFVTVVKDLHFDTSWTNRNRVWWMPYLLHFSIATLIGITFHSSIPAVAYWLGIMSHPLQGWLVNALAHRYGYQNYDNDDRSVNNTIVAWLVFGEGYQNNHHKFPASAKFSKKWFEVDNGYGLCKMAEFLGWIEIPKVVHNVDVSRPVVLPHKLASLPQDVLESN